MRSSKWVTPRNTSRMISSIHASPSRSVARAIEQATSANWVRFTRTPYLSLLRRLNIRFPQETRHVRFPEETHPKGAR